MKFTEKDPWGYHFAQPIFRYDPGISETVKRDPFKDRERERTNRMLMREYELDVRALDQGIDGEIIPWGLFRHEKRSRRRSLAEEIRALCLKAPGGRLGIAQAHHLAHKHGLLHTISVKCEAAAFPLALKVSDPVQGHVFDVDYALNLDRVFYPVFPERTYDRRGRPRFDRFADPLLLVDALRVFDGLGEARARFAVGKKPCVDVSTSEITKEKPLLKLKLAVHDQGTFDFREKVGREPAGAIADAMSTDVGGVESNHVGASRGYDVTLRSDVAGTREPWIALAVILADAWAQRTLGVLIRSVAHAEKQNEPGEPERDE